MYAQWNSEAHLCNHCCSGKAINITQPECVFVALDTQLWLVPLYNNYPLYLKNGMIFENKLINIIGACFNFLYNSGPKQKCFSEELCKI
jgi:hypothetical protein